MGDDADRFRRHRVSRLSPGQKDCDRNSGDLIFSGGWLMKTRSVGVAAALAVFSASPAFAAVIVTSVGGTPQAAVSGSSYITFEDVSVGTFGNFTSGGWNFTGTGLITNTTTVFPLTHAQPKFDTT